jgi:hypothetical protein
MTLYCIGRVRDRMQAAENRTFPLFGKSHQRSVFDRKPADSSPPLSANRERLLFAPLPICADAGLSACRKDGARPLPSPGARLP